MTRLRSLISSSQGYCEEGIIVPRHRLVKELTQTQLVRDSTGV